MSLKFGKPGPKIRSSKIKNSAKRLHKIARPDILICQNCSTESDTCCYCHPEDEEIKFLFGGKGIGEKTVDELVALLCSKCKAILDKKPDKNASRIIKLEHSIIWAKAILRTVAMRGNLK